MSYARWGARWLAVSLSLSAGCAFLPERPPPAALHDFGRPPEVRLGRPSGWSTIHVTSPDWLQDSRIRYRLLYRDPTRIRFYALDRWVGPPPELLAHRLREVGGCRVLDAELQDFEQVFESPERARMTLRFRATVREPGRGRVLGEREFRLAKATPTADAAGAVQATSGLVDQAVADLSRWFRELPREICPTQ